MVSRQTAAAAAAAAADGKRKTLFKWERRERIKQRPAIAYRLHATRTPNLISDVVTPRR